MLSESTTRRHAVAPTQVEPLSALPFLLRDEARVVELLPRPPNERPARLPTVRTNEANWLAPDHEQLLAHLLDSRRLRLLG